MSDDNNKMKEFLQMKPVKTIQALELFEKNGHMGSGVSTTHPNMKQYIYSRDNKFNIINLDMSCEAIQKACDFIFQKTCKGAKVLFVGQRLSKAKTEEDVCIVDVQAIAEKSGQFYIKDKWIPGLLTNFETVLGSLRQVKQMELNMNDYPTKKEKLVKSRIIAKRKAALGGITTLDKLPDLIISIGQLPEASKAKVDIISLMDTNENPVFANVTIPLNLNAVEAVNEILELFNTYIIEGTRQFLKSDEGKNSMKKIFHKPNGMFGNNTGRPPFGSRPPFTPGAPRSAFGNNFSGPRPPFTPGAHRPAFGNNFSGPRPPFTPGAHRPSFGNNPGRPAFNKSKPAETTPTETKPS